MVIWPAQVQFCTARGALLRRQTVVRATAGVCLNLSVGLPIDLLIYERDSLDVRREKRIEQDDEYFRKLSSAWSETLRSSFAKIEEFKLQAGKRPHPAPRLYHRRNDKLDVRSTRR